MRLDPRGMLLVWTQPRLNEPTADRVEDDDRASATVDAGECLDAGRGRNQKNQTDELTP